MPPTKTELLTTCEPSKVQMVSLVHTDNVLFTMIDVAKGTEPLHTRLLAAYNWYKVQET